MLKKIMTPLLIIAITSSCLHADVTTQQPPAEKYPTGDVMHPPSSSSNENPEATLEEPSSEEDDPDESLKDTSRPPREVGQASNEAVHAAKTRQWQNIGIACTAVAVAALAIYLASTNGGHDARDY